MGCEPGVICNCVHTVDHQTVFITSKKDRKKLSIDEVFKVNGQYVHFESYEVF